MLYVLNLPRRLTCLSFMYDAIVSNNIFFSGRMSCCAYEFWFYELLCLWILFPWIVASINFVSMSCWVYELSYLWIFISMNFHMYEFSNQWIFISMNFHIYKLSCLSIVVFISCHVCQLSCRLSESMPFFNIIYK